MLFRFLIFCIKWLIVIFIAYYIYKMLGKDRVDSVVSEVKDQVKGAVEIPKKL
jgi:hypothetical protein